MSANISMNDRKIKNDIALSVDVLAAHVMPFVGVGQFRFVALASRRLREAYSVQFPTKTTVYSISIVKMAKLCWDEAPVEDQRLLLRLAKEERWYYHVVLEDLNDKDWDLLKWTKSTFDFSWGFNNPHACTIAAQCGDLSMLHCLRVHGCP
jgi:hypothetical protein